MNKDKKGFTLIELLVVIAIIGLLSTLSVIALNSARARARDAKRISDVKQMQVALEMYYNDVGDYPATDSITPTTPPSSIASDSGVYLRVIPEPPTPYDGSVCAINQGESYEANKYLYKRTGGPGEVPSYTITFCLGSPVGQGDSQLAGNTILTMTPAGIY